MAHTFTGPAEQLQLLAFIRARLVDRERTQTGLQQWHAPDCAAVPDYDNPTFECTCGAPARILAEVAALRALLADLLNERHHVNDGDDWFTCAAATQERDGGTTVDDARLGKPCDCGRDFRLTRRLRLLAQPNADHTDYLPQWRPEGR